MRSARGGIFFLFLLHPGIFCHGRHVHLLPQTIDLGRVLSISRGGVSSIEEQEQEQAEAISEILGGSILAADEDIPPKIEEASTATDTSVVESVEPMAASSIEREPVVEEMVVEDPFAAVSTIGGGLEPALETDADRPEMPADEDSSSSAATAAVTTDPSSTATAATTTADSSSTTTTTAASSSASSVLKSPRRAAFVMKDRVRKSVHQLARLRQNMNDRLDETTFARMGPTLLTMFGGRDGAVSFQVFYAFALLGSSVGFYIFLYFISIGYALGVGLPLGYALIKTSKENLSTSTLLHSSLVLLWSVRAAVFYAWREYVSWPALHEKVLQVNHQKPPHLLVRMLCWCVYSFLYVCMTSPCWFRLMMESSSDQGDKSSSARSGQAASSRKARLTKGCSTFGIVLQVVGLLVESVADWQKSHFKQQQVTDADGVVIASQRNTWCHVGLFKYSTHPNYAGEWIFWLGTHLAGLPTTLSMRNPLQIAFSLTGFLFISIVLKGATVFLSQKQWSKYRDIPEFVEFRKHVGVFGPKFWIPQFIVAQQESTDASAETIE